MTSAEVKEIEERLGRYIEEMFAGLGRRERRAALGAYLKGLLLDGERKSVSPIAKRLAPHACEAEALRQRIQQAVVVASWDDEVVYRRLAKRVDEELPIQAWVVDDTGFPKKGRHSVGVQRQYSGTLGRVDNCQVATSLHMASEHSGACIGMRLYLPKQWTDDASRCAKAGVPTEVTFKKKWENALALIDRALGWSIKKHPVVGDTEFGDNRMFRSALDVRNLKYVLNISAKTSAWPPDVTPKPPKRTGKVGRPRTCWTAAKRPRSVQDIANELPLSAWRTITWRNGSRGPQRGRFAAVRIRTAHRHAEGHPPSGELWLLCQWPRSAKQPTTFWISNMPATTSNKRLVYLAKMRWRVERDYQEMKSQLGLDHFEGRTWSGFHHHVACVALAHAFLALDRARFPPQPSTRITDLPAAPSTRFAQHDWPLPDLQSSHQLTCVESHSSTLVIK